MDRQGPLGGGVDALAIYAVFLGEFVDDESLPDFWNSAAAWFNWGMKLPGGCISPLACGERITGNSTGCSVNAAFRMSRIPSAWPGNDTGNSFLTSKSTTTAITPRTNTRQEYTVEISCAGETVGGCKTSHDRGWAACYHAAEHPEIYATIMELLGRCIVHSQESKNKKKHSNRELMELAAECKDHLEANRSGRSSVDRRMKMAVNDHSNVHRSPLSRRSALFLQSGDFLLEYQTTDNEHSRTPL